MHRTLLIVAATAALVAAVYFPWDALFGLTGVGVVAAFVWR